MREFLVYAVGPRDGRYFLHSGQHEHPMFATRNWLRAEQTDPITNTDLDGKIGLVVLDKNTRSEIGYISLNKGA